MVMMLLHLYDAMTDREERWVLGILLCTELGRTIPAYCQITENGCYDVQLRK